MKSSTIEWNGVRDIVLIVVVWCVGVLIVNPIGNFPLVDDWSFGQTVAHLLDTGEYKPLGRVGPMTLITNVLWGALFCLPAGFSFTALRLSTLVAALVGLIGVYVLIRDLQQSRRVAWLGVLLLAFNPLYYALSFGFMTDVLFIALLVWAGVFFARTLRSGSNRDLLIATLFALAATLSRQLALCLPMGFAAASLLQSRVSLKSVLRASIPAAVCLAAYLALYSSGLTRREYGEQLVIAWLLDAQTIVKTMVTNIFYITIHLGLFLLPVLFLAMSNLWKARADRVIRVAPAALLLVLAIVVARAHYGKEILLPLFDNWLVKSGVGMTLLRDAFILNMDNLQPLPVFFWVTVTALGLAGAVMLITTLCVHAWKLIAVYRTNKALTNDDLIASFGLITSALYFLLLLLLPKFYDKYVIPMIPFLIMALLCLGSQSAWSPSSVPKSARFALYALLTAFALFSVMGTRDFLAWNRVRWAALQELMHDGRIGPEDIDGGFEFNGLHLYDSAARPPKGSDVSWWWVRRDTYLIAFGPVPGYSVVKEYTYQHWLPWHVQKIVVLLKK